MSNKKFFLPDDYLVDDRFIKGQEKYGTVEYNDYFQVFAEIPTTIERPKPKIKKVAITQKPYIDGLPGKKPLFKASGVDADGNEYYILWEAVGYWEKHDDEQLMVEEWEKPISVVKI